MRVIALEDRRTAAPAEASPLPRRRLPLLHQFFSGNESKRRRWNRRAGAECGARRLSALAAMAVTHRRKFALDLVPNTTTKTGTFKHLSSFRTRAKLRFASNVLFSATSLVPSSKFIVTAPSMSSLRSFYCFISFTKLQSTNWLKGISLVILSRSLVSCTSRLTPLSEMMPSSVKELIEVS